MKNQIKLIILILFITLSLMAIHYDNVININRIYKITILMLIVLPYYTIIGLKLLNKILKR
jgi:hypothetical protein